MDKTYSKTYPRLCLQLDIHFLNIWFSVFELLLLHKHGDGKKGSDYSECDILTTKESIPSSQTSLYHTFHEYTTVLDRITRWTSLFRCAFLISAAMHSRLNILSLCPWIIETPLHPRVQTQLRDAESEGESGE